MTDKRALLFQALQPSEAQTLVAIMGRIVPHGAPELKDVVWQTALAYDSQLATNIGLRSDIRSQLQDLDKRSREQGAPSFAEAAPNVQDAVLQYIEGTALFQNLIYATVADFYNRHAVWEAIGYPGLAQRDGVGYLNKGFDTLEWI